MKISSWGGKIYLRYYNGLWTPKGHSTSQMYSISIVLAFHGDGGKVGEKDSLGSDHENGLRNTALTLKDCCEFLVKKKTKLPTNVLLLKRNTNLVECSCRHTVREFFIFFILLPVDHLERYFYMYY